MSSKLFLIIGLLSLLPFTSFALDLDKEIAKKNKIAESLKITFSTKELSTEELIKKKSLANSNADDSLKIKLVQKAPNQ